MRLNVNWLSNSKAQFLSPLSPLKESPLLKNSRILTNKLQSSEKWCENYLPISKFRHKIGIVNDSKAIMTPKECCKVVLCPSMSDQQAWQDLRLKSKRQISRVKTCHCWEIATNLQKSRYPAKLAAHLQRSLMKGENNADLLHGGCNFRQGCNIPPLGSFIWIEHFLFCETLFKCFKVQLRKLRKFG